MIGSIPKYRSRICTTTLCWILLGLRASIAVNASGTESLGAVASESKLCSEIGIELLKRGVSQHRHMSRVLWAEHVTSGECCRCTGWNYSVRGSNW